MSVSEASDPGDTKNRRFAESVLETFGTLGSYLSPAVNTIKDTTNPSYWVPDSECQGKTETEPGDNERKDLVLITGH